MKKFFRIHVKGSPVVFFDYPAPNDATLLNFIAITQACGYVLNDNFFIPYDEIKHISVFTMENNNVQPFKPTVV